MAVAYQSPIGHGQSFLDDNGDPLASGTLDTQEAGTSTAKATYKDNAQAATHANPIVLGADGRVPGDALWLDNDVAYKFILKDSLGVTIFTIDDIDPIVPPAATADEWVTGPTPTFISATQFSVSGDQTSIFHVNRRIKATDSTTLYGYISASSFAASITTVTVVLDSGSLSSSLSVMEYALLSADNLSVPPALLLNTVDERQTDTGTTIESVKLQGGKAAAESNRNLIVNPDGEVGQRGTTFDAASTPANDDDTYLLDRWLHLSDGADRADVSREATVIPTGSRFSTKFDVETVGSPSEKFGMLQILEGAESIKLRGKKVSLSFQARTTSGQVENLRAVVVEWTGSVDAPTSDIVNVWGAEGTNITVVASWALLNTAANLVLTNVFQKFSIEGITVGASANNLGVFIWVDDTDLVAADVFYVAQVNLEEGDVVSLHETRDLGEELQLSQRFFCKTYDQGDAPGTSTLNGSLRAVTVAGAANKVIMNFAFPAAMRNTPTVTAYSTTGASGNMRDLTAGGDLAAAAVDVGESGTAIHVTGTPTFSNINAVQATAEAEL